MIASKTDNDILNAKYEVFLKDTEAMLQNEFRLLYRMLFMNLMHDLWTNTSKNCIVGTSIAFVDPAWAFVYLALLGETKSNGYNSEDVCVWNKERSCQYINFYQWFFLITASKASLQSRCSRVFDWGTVHRQPFKKGRFRPDLLL
ncbi:hypothetical protein Pcac1_g5560 [Phytophthora cactorum]|uniref:Uncharacterized protein n=1 Tax=Phytophthora cactorum TaxID=29920 RepID=A0A8T1GJG6_9STRA|nr:hypothetical protein Pcac1_g5560 [Phytophthora cactorum]KAG2992611.1 hypothetical protein PC118_g4450 [Phytophthora cactorum]KAG3035147.1 hypothetical protein PC119_g4696 [Phytophthora cactorum]KAG3097827.1 hypothetical protein PC122_g4289 [Phytophthora cactorum]